MSPALHVFLISFSHTLANWGQPWLSGTILNSVTNILSFCYFSMHMSSTLLCNWQICGYPGCSMQWLTLGKTRVQRMLLCKCSQSVIEGSFSSRCWSAVWHSVSTQQWQHCRFSSARLIRGIQHHGPPFYCNVCEHNLIWMALCYHGFFVWTNQSINHVFIDAHDKPHMPHSFQSMLKRQTEKIRKSLQCLISRHLVQDTRDKVTVRKMTGTSIIAVGSQIIVLAGSGRWQQ